MIILSITPDHEVARHSDSITADKLQQLYDENCVILKIEDDRQVYDWIGRDGDAPAIGWARVEYHSIE